VELVDHVIPDRDLRTGRGPGRPPLVTDAEIVCLAVAQVLLRFYDERHWMRAARSRVGHLFPRLLEQSESNERVKQAGPLMEAAMRWLAEHTPATGEQLRLMDATPIGCGQSTTTARRSNLFGWARYGYESAHSRWYWGVKLLLLTTADGTVTGFGLANPKLLGERAETREVLGGQPANRPRPGSTVVTDKGLSGADSEQFFTDCDLVLVRPARRREDTATVPELATPTHRSDHLDPEEPTRPGTAPSQSPRRPLGPHPATAPGPQHRHLAQLDHRRTRQTITHRLRPLTSTESPVNDLGDGPTPA
jgi:hypothetical protein